MHWGIKPRSLMYNPCWYFSGYVTEIMNTNRRRIDYLSSSLNAPKVEVVSKSLHIDYLVTDVLPSSKKGKQPGASAAASGDLSVTPSLLGRKFGSVNISYFGNGRIDVNFATWQMVENCAL